MTMGWSHVPPWPLPESDFCNRVTFALNMMAFAYHDLYPYLGGYTSFENTD